MSDIYAEFGVKDAVMANEQHEQDMLAKDVVVRDGDDLITLEEPEETEGEPTEEVKSPEETETTTAGADPEETEGADPEETEGEDSEFGPVGDVPVDLQTSATQLDANEQGFLDMVDKATSAGLSQESLDRIKAEYLDEGLTDASYSELEAAGFGRAFVDSYLAGQEALVQQYVQGVIAYAGGQDKFNALYAHLQATSPDSADQLAQAMENRNLPLVKALINLAATSRGKVFGKPSERSVTKRATPAAPAKAVTVEGYASRAEMVKAMSDPRYATDAVYREGVRSKTLASSF